MMRPSASTTSRFSTFSFMVPYLLPDVCVLCKKEIYAPHSIGTRGTSGCHATERGICPGVWERKNRKWLAFLVNDVSPLSLTHWKPESGISEVLIECHSGHPWLHCCIEIISSYFDNIIHFTKINTDTSLCQQSVYMQLKDVVGELL